jgi:hypothetical protein
VIYDPTPRSAKIGDALSQLGNVSWLFWPHRTTTPNESISGRCFRERRWFRHVVDALFFWQRNPGHCERAFYKDLDRARRMVEIYHSPDA